MTPNSIRTATMTNRPRRTLTGAFRIWLYAGLLAVLLPVLAHGQQTVTEGMQSISMPPKPTSIILPAANRAPDANDRMQMQQQRLKRAGFEKANTERMHQIDSDSAQILKLASELKAEIDRTPKDLLSLSVVRKAEEIERLAHNVQMKMKLTVAAN